MPTIKINSSPVKDTVRSPINVSSPLLPECSTIPNNVSPKAISPPLKSNFNIPKNLFSGFIDVLRAEQLKLAQSVAEEFGISYEDLISKCLPEIPHIELTTEPTKPKAKKAKKETITNYTDAKSLDDLVL